MRNDTPLASRRGFGALSPERRTAIATSGGIAAHVRGTAHQWDREAARIAGRKGGQISAAKRAARKAATHA